MTQARGRAARFKIDKDWSEMCAGNRLSLQWIKPSVGLSRHFIHSRKAVKELAGLRLGTAMSHVAQLTPLSLSAHQALRPQAWHPLLTTYPEGQARA